MNKRLINIDLIEVVFIKDSAITYTMSSGQKIKTKYPDNESAETHLKNLKKIIPRILEIEQ